MRLDLLRALEWPARGERARTVIAGHGKAREGGTNEAARPAGTRRLADAPVAAGNQARGPRHARVRNAGEQLHAAGFGADAIAPAARDAVEVI